jgi:hypothetical protein
VSRILAVLPPDHPARLAHERGIDTIRLTHMVGDAALVTALIEALPRPGATCGSACWSASCIALATA